MAIRFAITVERDRENDNTRQVWDDVDPPTVSLAYTFQLSEISCSSAYNDNRQRVIVETMLACHVAITIAQHFCGAQPHALSSSQLALLVF
eukprot:SAG31_NODE_9790_length_1226_cov_25.005324_2_plen_90_part_01